MTTTSSPPAPTPAPTTTPAAAPEVTTNSSEAPTTRPRSSTLDKLKSILCLPTSESSSSTPTPAATATPAGEKPAFVPSVEHPTAPSPHDVRFQIRERQTAHEAAEAEADRHIQEREAEEKIHGAVGTGGPVGLSRMSSLGRRPSLGVAAGKDKERKHHPHGKHGISSGGLAAVGGTLGGGGGELAYGSGQPDMTGVTRIPEGMLPQRVDRMERTATRPSDPNDPNSMDGAPDETSAGDDLAI